MAQASPPPGPGLVASLHLAAHPGEPTFPLAQVRAVTGRGLVGDRNYWAGEGPRPRRRGTGRASGVCAITLIEAESLDALAREHDILLAPAECRRNLVCRDIRLNPLVDHEFRIGTVILRGLRLSEPCARLEQLVRPGLIRGLLHRGGLRAEVVHGGTIRVGDRIHPPPHDAQSPSPSTHAR
ncbi:MOSC domain-containing protein [Streptomyces sp. NBC_01255]|uniref:MOSC domain-containing protein n=1 Tax=Streptomyces sp. NBC_01255 TaxID=2903798 RepID=UPI002E3763E8|nr:MOSC domain-containing protein [Streptomyces sp. NBC_01255]